MNCCDGCPFCDKSQVRPRTAMELLELVKQLQRELDYIRIAVESTGGCIAVKDGHGRA